MEGDVGNHPNPWFRDIQLRKTFPGRGKCWFHRVFHKPLLAACFPGLSLSLLPDSGQLSACSQPGSAGRFSEKQNKTKSRGDKTPYLLEAQGKMLLSRALVQMEKSPAKTGEVLQLFAEG